MSTKLEQELATVTESIPVDIECPDCHRNFHLETKLQVLRCRQAGDRCPTCAFNYALEFVPSGKNHMRRIPATEGS